MTEAATGVEPEPLDPERRDDLDYAERLELATRGLLELSVGVLSDMEENVSPSHLRALQSLDRLRGAKVTALADALGVPPSTASRISDRLTAAGLITREVAADNRRATWLELTASGRAVLRDLVHARARALNEVAGALTDAERDALLRGAEAFAAVHRRMQDDGDQRRAAAGRDGDRREREPDDQGHAAGPHR